MEDYPKIVAFLQNQWFPEKSIGAVKSCYERHGSTPEGRAKVNARYLFFRCLSGKRLRAALGESLCDKIIWENASPEIASNSSGAFAADPEHIKGVISHFQPDIVATFGSIATQAVANYLPPGVLLCIFPHPAARFPDINRRLKGSANLLSEQIGSFDCRKT